MKVAALVLAFAASALAEDVAPSFPGSAVPPKITAPPNPDAARVQGPLTIHVTNKFGIAFSAILYLHTKANSAQDLASMSPSATTPAAQLPSIILITALLA